MTRRRYSFIIADRASGIVQRFTVQSRSTALVIAAILAIPIGCTLNAGWQAQAEIDRLKLQNARLEIENSSYRATASELMSNISSVQAAMSNLADRSQVDPALRHSLDRLPNDFQVDARGGLLMLRSVGVASPRYALDLLSDLLLTLDNRLQVIRHGVARREALAEATPIIWPAAGWISGSYGYRPDPFTGEQDFHAAVDISTRKGQPVYATATGRILSASRSGNYGNLVKIDHGFDLATRYGHLSEFAVEVGDTVRRGDVIGFVGATGRATGYHVHYEVWANGRTLNPMRLLAETRPVAAN